MVNIYILNSLLCFHAFIICFSKVAWNTHIIIFGWGENSLMGISFIPGRIKKKLFFQVKNFKLGFVNYLCGRL